jgi:hypothetical protein
MGRLNAANTSNNSLMEQIYGVGGTADAPMADGLMAQLNALYMAAADDAIAHQKAIGMAIMGKVSTAGDPITLGVDAVERMFTATSTPVLAPDEMAMWHNLSTEGWATSGFFMREEEVDHDNDGDTADVTRNTKVAVYSNVEGPQSEEFGMYYTAAATPGLPGVTSVVRNEADDADDGVQLDAGTGATGIAALAGWVMGDGFPTTPPTGETAMRAWVDDADTEAVNESEPSFPGSFRGVMGMYKCTSGPCSASVNDKGDLTNLAGTWAFRPDDYTSEIAGVSPDSEYAYFGFWLEVTEDEDGKETFGIRGVAGGGGVAYTDIQISATDLMGKATFSGDATGKYMAKKLTPYGQIADAVSGQFIADVEMTAVFGDVQDELLGDQNKVWGTVDNFRDPVEADSAALMSRMAADGTDASWSVDLNRANISSTGLDDHAGDDSFFGGTTTGDGSWTAQFFGGEDKTKMPGHVAGTFDAHFSNGHVVGGFAAENNAPAE